MNNKRFGQEADIGDLILLTNGGYTTAGFVMRIEEKYVFLSNRETRNADGLPRKPGYFRSFPDEKQWKERYKYWDTYQIIYKSPYADTIFFSVAD